MARFQKIPAHRGEFQKGRNGPSEPHVNTKIIIHVVFRKCIHVPKRRVEGQRLGDIPLTVEGKLVSGVAGPDQPVVGDGVAPPDILLEVRAQEGVRAVEPEAGGDLPAAFDLKAVGLAAAEVVILKQGCIAG